MVEQADAKKMGFGEFTVFKKLRTTLKKRGAKSDQCAKKIKNLLKNGHSDSSDHKEQKGGGDGKDKDKHKSKKDKK